MRLRARLERLSGKIPEPPCPECGGGGGPVVIVEAYDAGDGLPWPPPCPGCGCSPSAVFLTLSPACRPAEGDEGATP